MAEESEIGEILWVEEEQKTWPFVTTGILIAISIILCAPKTGVPTFLIILFWICFILVQIYRMASKRIMEFGTHGYILRNKVFKSSSAEVVPYSKVSQPRVNITNNRVNGIHNSYIYEVDYGTIKFTYGIGHFDRIFNDFEYDCSHTLYRYKNFYLNGNDQDYDDNTWLYLSRAR